MLQKVDTVRRDNPFVREQSMDQENTGETRWSVKSWVASVSMISTCIANSFTSDLPEGATGMEHLDLIRKTLGTRAIGGDEAREACVKMIAQLFDKHGVVEGLVEDLVFEDGPFRKHSCKHFGDNFKAALPEKRLW